MAAVNPSFWSYRPVAVRFVQRHMLGVIRITHGDTTLHGKSLRTIDAPGTVDAKFSVSLGSNQTFECAQRVCMLAPALQGVKRCQQQGFDGLKWQKAPSGQAQRLPENRNRF